MKKTYEIDTDDLTEPEEQLAFLINECVIFCNNGWWDEKWPKDAISLHVNCNDIFAWGCADSEDIRCGELKDLTDLYLKDEAWGAAVWCIKKRRQMPQAPVAKDMREAGYNLEELIATPIDEIAEKPLDSNVNEKHLSPET
jgi:hypothetical protein